MKIFVLTILGMTLCTVPAFAQTAAPEAVPPVLNVEIPDLPNVSRDSACGGRPAVAQQAICVSTTQAALSGVVDSLNVSFTEQNWIAAGGSDNLVVYVKRRPEGGCDGFQMLAFADTLIATPEAPAWLAFAGIPGNVCADPDAAAAAEAAPPAPPQ